MHGNWRMEFVGQHSPPDAEVINIEGDRVVLVHHRDKDKIDLTLGWSDRSREAGFSEKSITLTRGQATKLVKSLIQGLGLNVRTREVVHHEVEIS